MDATTAMWDELSQVTPEMLEAGSRADLAVSVVRVSDPKTGRMVTMPSNATADQRLTAVYRAMLRTRLLS